MSRTIVRNTASLLTSQVLTWLVSMVGLLVIPNRLGANDFGAASFAIAYVGFFALVGSFGTPTYIVRAVARDHSIAGDYVANGLVFKLMSWSVVSVAAIVLALLLGYDNTTIILILIGLGGMFFGLMNEVFTAGLAGMEIMARPALWATVQAYTIGIASVSVVLLGGGVIAFMIAMVAPSIIPLVANATHFRRFWPRAFSVSRFVLSSMIRGGWPLFALSGLLMVYGSIDIPILDWLTDNETVARYALAYRWAAIPVFISGMVVTAFVPSLSFLAKQDRDGFRNLANRALRLVFVVAVPAAVGLIMVAPTLIGLLYKDDFAETSTLMRILALHIPIAALDTVLGAALIAADRQSSFLKFAALAAIINPVVTVGAVHFSLLWFDDGGIGAAVATVLTEVFMLLGILHARGDTGVMDRATVGFGLRCLVATAPMVPVLFLARGTHLVVQITLGIAIYVPIAVALRVAPLRRVIVYGRTVARREPPGTIPAVESEPSNASARP